jgi:hypothetical protein
MIDISTPFLDQLLWQYLCFAKQFRSHVILSMFHDNMADDIIFYILSSILETLASVQLKWSRNPP